jgi:hypothetical protein
MVARILIILIVFAVACAPAPHRQPEGPAIVVGKETWEFGTLKRGETAGTEIEIANVGSNTLRISVYSTCDCLSARLGSDAIAPGKSTSLVVSYMGDEVKARVTKTVFLDSNDPAKPRLTLTVTGKVLPGDLPHLVATPSPLPYDAATGDETPLLAIANKGRQNLKIGTIRCYGCTSRWDFIELASGEQIEIDIVVLPDWNGKRWIEIESNDPVSPLMKVVIVEMD